MPGPAAPTKQGEEEAEPARDWNAIALEYETGDDGVSLSYLARKHGIPEGTLKKHSTADQWVAKRERFRDQRDTEIRQRIRRRYLAGVEKDFDRLEGAIIQVVRQIVEGKPVKFVSKKADGTSEIVEFTAALEANSLDAAGNVLCNLLKAKANLSGVPGEVVATEQTGITEVVIRDFRDDEARPDSGDTGLPGAATVLE